MFNEFDYEQRGPGEQGPKGRRRGGPGHGHGGPGGHFRAPMRRDGRRARGDVRAAVLVLLDEQPRNGYQLIQELIERSNDAWRPSPGSIYPVLQQLEDEGLVETTAAGTGRTYDLTGAGRALVEEQRSELGKPWENTDTTGRVARELMGTARDVVLAARQVMVAGSASQVAKATAILVETRRALYGILAEGDQAS